MEETEDAEKMGFLAAIRGKSQRWVTLSCDAHLVSSGQGRIRQPCVQSSYWDQTRANIFLMSTILRGKLNWQMVLKQSGSLGILALALAPAGKDPRTVSPRSKRGQ